MGLPRRELLKTSLLATTSSALVPNALARAATGDEPGGDLIDIRMSGYPHQHVRGLVTGQVGIEGCMVGFEPGKIGDINTHVFSGPRELGVTEIGLAPFITAFANDGFRAYSLLPVFPLRIFRHKSIFVRSDSGIDNPEQLRGKRIGTPRYSTTSLTWIRGIMSDEYGLRPEDVEWVISAEDSSKAASGSASRQEQVIPEGIVVSRGPAGRDESELLLDGEVDALFHAAEPRAFIEGDPRIRRLFPDARSVEQEYYARTGIYPLMHAVAIRNDLAKQHPWLPKAVFDAYSQAKQLTYQDMHLKWFLRTMPWFAQELEATQELMGDNFFPYGIEANRRSIEPLFRYMHEQGFANRVLSVEDVFLPSALELAEA